MAKILIEESALDSIKRMAQELQNQRDELLAALQACLKKGNKWHTCDTVVIQGRSAIARCQESTKVFE